MKRPSADIREMMQNGRTDAYMIARCCSFFIEAVGTSALFQQPFHSSPCIVRRLLYMNGMIPNPTNL
jgi:hypothetical protein